MIFAESSSLVAHEKVIIDSLVVILVTATIVSLLFQRLRLAVVPAFLVAGLLVGPSGFGFTKSMPALEEIAHLAVVLLLFGVGMELHLSSLRVGFLRLVASSLIALALCILLLFLPLISFGLTPGVAIVVAMALSLSSTAVVLRTLSLRRELGNSHGQLSLAILVTQDLAVLAMLAIVPIIASLELGAQSDHSLEIESLSIVLSKLSIKLSAFVLMVIVLRKAIPFLLKEALRDRSGELLMLVGVASALLTAYLTLKLGFSLEMGAFLAGFVLASSPFRYQLAGRMSPLRDLFMAIFFTTLGMELDLNIILEHWGMIVFATTALILIKTFAIALAAYLSGISAQLAVRTGLALSQAGEFSLLLLSQATQYKIFEPAFASTIISVVVLSLIFTPGLFRLAPSIYLRFRSTWIAPWFSSPWAGERSTKGDQSSDSTNDIVIAGYGPLGQHLAAQLEEQGMSFCVVELNTKTVEKERSQGRHFIFGDIAEQHLLDSLNIEGSSVLALTFPDTLPAVAAVSLARAKSADLLIVARSQTRRDAAQLVAAGANHVVIDEDASASRMLSVIASSSEKYSILEGEFIK